ncbi:MAG: prepilin peptidase [Capsulimonadaceae bacterium]
MSLSPLQMFAVVCAFIFGITIGSFLNVVIWRLPRGGSICVPVWSYCPRCEHRLVAADLVPVLSFLALGCRCRYCREPISWRYPAIELLTALLFMAVAWKFGPTLDTIFYCLFVAVLVCVFFIDLEHFIIPDGLNATAVLLGITHNVVQICRGQPGQFARVGAWHVPASLAGLALYAGIIYTIGLLSYVWLSPRPRGALRAAWEYVCDNVVDWILIALTYLSYIIPPLRKFVPEPEPLEGCTAEEIESDDEAGGMGGGDGKLAAGIGAMLFPVSAVMSLFLALIIGAITGLPVLLRRGRASGRTPVPFGPSMAAAAFLVLLFAGQFMRMYVSYWNYSLGGSSAAPSGTHAPLSGAN